MTDRVDSVVIGAGVVGLAVAASLATRGRDVLVLERHRLPAQETSSRNSGVIHSGIYYPPGSLKARLCVRGRDLLYSYCERRDVGHRRCGKLVVAMASQEEALRALLDRGLANGVTGLCLLDKAAAHRLEPYVRCSAAMFSPDTGIVDVHELVLSLVADIEASGGTVAYRTSVRSLDLVGPDIQLEILSGEGSMRLRCSTLINAAGLDAVDLLGKMNGYPARLLRKPYYAKGSYFSLRGPSPFRHLVYPMPGEAGLGIHATLDLNGSARFGPNVEWVNCPDYVVDERHVDEFYRSIRTYWPTLPDGGLQPAYAGVRPKLVGQNSPAADFVIEGPAVHGRHGLVNLLGVESPGLTSALAIGEHVAELLREGSVRNSG